MARLISAPTASLFGKGLFGTLSQNTVDYLQGHISQLASAGTEHGRKIYERSMAVFNAINSDAVVMAAEMVLSQSEAMQGLDVIEPLLTIRQLQGAQPLMQNWIMADPFIRQSWYDGRVEGYCDTYVDPEPKYIAHEQQAYRQLMQGVLVEHEEMAWQYSTYFDRETEKDKMLTLRELAAIFDTQEAARNAILDGGLDPVSQYGASL